MDLAFGQGIVRVVHLLEEGWRLQQRQVDPNESGILHRTGKLLLTVNWASTQSTEPGT